MANSRFTRVCRHCHKSFVPDWRNRHRQFYCRKPACRKARKTASQRRWLAQNPDHSKHPKHAERVRLWRERRRRRAHRPSGAEANATASGQSSAITQPCVDQAVSSPLLQDRFELLQDSIIRNQFMLRLLCYIFECSSKDNIETRIRELIKMGAEIERGFVAGGGPLPTTHKNTAMTTRP